MAIQTALFKAGRVISKKAPMILTITGTAGVGLAGYLTFKAAPKVNDIVADARARNEEEPLTKKEKAEVIFDIAKVMTAPVGVGVASIGCFIWAYNIQAGRIYALTGAFSAATSKLEEFRDKYIEKYGEEAFKEFRKKVTQKETTQQDAKGKEKKVIEEVPDRAVNILDGFWYSESPEYFHDDHMYNMENVKMVVSGIETSMFQRGQVLVNEVLEAFGLERTRQGALLGWSTNIGFDISVHYMWNELKQDREPQIYIRWDSPRYIYEDIEFGNRYAPF